MAQRTQLSEARTRRLGPQPQMPEMMPEEPAPEPALLEQETALTASNVSLEEMIPVQGSASKHKLSMFLDSRSAAEGSDKGCVITRSSFKFYSRLWPVLNASVLNLGFVQKMRASALHSLQERHQFVLFFDPT